MFSKPALRNTPKPSYKPKPEVKESPAFREVLKSSGNPESQARPGSQTKHTFEPPALKSTGRRLPSHSDEVFDDDLNNSASSGDGTFEKPALRQTARPPRQDSIGDTGSAPSHTFEKPALKAASTPVAVNTRIEQFTPGTFEKPALKKSTPSPEKEVKSVSEHKGVFDRPALRKTGTPGRELEREKTPEKPSWLQQAAEKQNKALEAIQHKGGIMCEHVVAF